MSDNSWFRHEAVNREKDTKQKKNKGLFGILELQFREHRFWTKQKSALIMWGKPRVLIREKKGDNYLI